MKILKAILDKKHQECPKNGSFPPFATSQDFFQKSGSVTFVPLWCTNFMQKIRKILRAVFEIWTKNIKNAPKRGVFPIYDPPRFFFKNRALSLLYHYDALASCKKLEQINGQSLRYLKTDKQKDAPTDRGDYI